MTWAMANQDLARVIKVPEIPDVISVRAKGDEIAEVCDNMSKINESKDKNQILDETLKEIQKMFPLLLLNQNQYQAPYLHQQRQK